MFLSREEHYHDDISAVPSLKCLKVVAYQEQNYISCNKRAILWDAGSTVGQSNQGWAFHSHAAWTS